MVSTIMGISFPYIKSRRRQEFEPGYTFVTIAPNVDFQQMAAQIVWFESLPSWIQQELDQNSEQYNLLEASFRLGIKQTGRIHKLSEKEHSRDQVRVLMQLGGVSGRVYTVTAVDEKSYLSYTQTLIARANRLKACLQTGKDMKVFDLYQDPPFVKPQTVDLRCAYAQMQGLTMAYNPTKDDYRGKIALEQTLKAGGISI